MDTMEGFSSKDIMAGVCIAHSWLETAKLQGDDKMVVIYQRILDSALKDYEQAKAREAKYKEAFI